MLVSYKEFAEKAYAAAPEGKRKKAIAAGICIDNRLKKEKSFFDAALWLKYFDADVIGVENTLKGFGFQLEKYKSVL